MCVQEEEDVYTHSGMPTCQGCVKHVWESLVGVHVFVYQELGGALGQPYGAGWGGRLGG